MRTTHAVATNRRRSGFVLILAALSLVTFLGIMGLVLDLARMWSAKNELQAYVDAAAIAAAFELNGTAQGITDARNLAMNYPDAASPAWNFRKSQAENVTVEFAPLAAGPWQAAPLTPAGMQFVRVRAEAPVTLFFMPGFSAVEPKAMLLSPVARQHTIRSRASAGQFRINRFGTGLIPYSPDAPVPDAPEFGFTRGQQYTLRWPPPGQRNKPNNWCAGDKALGFVSPSPAAQRGFIDLGDSGAFEPDPLVEYNSTNGSAFIREAIVSDVQAHALETGDLIVGSPGNRGTESDALRERFLQDMDVSSTTYAQYLAAGTGSGRRVVVVPINDPFGSAGPAGRAQDEVIGFGAFFLPDINLCGAGGSSVAPCCAEFIGPAVLPGRRAGGGAAGAFRVRLFE